LSCCVYTSLQQISSGGSHRITDMWRTGSTIAHFNSGKHKSTSTSDKDSATLASRKGSDNTHKAGSTKLSTVDTLAVHEAAQSLLSYVMNDADGETNADTDVTMNADSDMSTAGDDLYVQMKELYISTPPPFKSLLPSHVAKNDNNNSNKLCDRLRNDIQVLQRDPNLLTAVNTLLKQALPILAHQASTDHTSHTNTNCTTTTTTSITVQQAKKGLLALSMCRIMHALPTKLLPATAWRDRSDAWGSHKDVDFDQLLTFVVQELH